MYLDQYRDFLVLYEKLLEMAKTMPRRAFQEEFNALMHDYVDKYPGTSPWYIAAYQTLMKKFP